MAHVRTQIRSAIKDALVAQLGTTYDVYSSRRYRLNTTDRPMIDMRISNVDVSQITMGNDRTHIAQLYVRVQRQASESGIDDLLDADEVAVTAVIESIDFSSLLEEDPELKQVVVDDNSDGETVVGMIVLRYDVEYRVLKNDPETVRA